jgi:hypothetical protein
MGSLTYRYPPPGGAPTLGYPDDVLKYLVALGPRVDEFVAAYRAYASNSGIGEYNLRNTFFRMTGSEMRLAQRDPLRDFLSYLDNLNRLCFSRGIVTRKEMDRMAAISTDVVNWMPELVPMSVEA